MLEINKIHLGDCFELIKKIPNKSVDLIYIDIPYLFDTGGGGQSELCKRAIKTKMELSEISNGIDYKIFDDFVRVMKKINIFIWCSKSQILDIMNYFNAIPNVNFEVLVWIKDNPTPLCNNTWLPDIEYCLYFREKGVKLNDGYELKSKFYQSPINKKDKNLYDHPTIKPLELVKRHILHTTQENDVVLDSFIGSGTTAVACIETKRNYIGIEVNPEYHKIATDRVNGVSQQEIREKEKGITNIFDFL